MSSAPTKAQVASASMEIHLALLEALGGTVAINVAMGPNGRLEQHVPGEPGSLRKVARLARSVIRDAALPTRRST